jgi:hypothetical protein
MVGSGNGYTGNTPSPTMKLDYWFADASGDAQPTWTSVVTSPGTFSDHYPLAATFVLGTSAHASTGTATLALNQQTFSLGNQLGLRAIVDPGSNPANADLYVALEAPGCTSLACAHFWQGGTAFTAAPQPILRNWPIQSFDGTIFTYTFGGAEPAGTYTFLAAFTVPGTGTVIGNITQISFTFSR